VVEPGARVPDLDELGAFLLARGLATRRLPEQVERVDVLPQTPGGKIDKRALRDRLDRITKESP
jgi:non-ribosomal peptide synthetase component E (peptide arylation enzyme)